MHWVCIKLEKINISIARMTVADGLNYPISELISQASSMVKGTMIDKIEIVKLYTQKQLNGYDCGPMTAAFAYMFCCGIDFNENVFDASSIRNHITNIAMGKDDFKNIGIFP